MGFKKNTMFKRICLAIIKFYQKNISPLKPKVCRYYPSCSEYTSWQFQKNHFLFACYFSFLRILKCNPFFKGGIDYPKIYKIIKHTNFCFKPIFLAKKRLSFLYIPCKDKGFFIIKII